MSLLINFNLHSENIAATPVYHTIIATTWDTFYCLFRSVMCHVQQIYKIRWDLFISLSSKGPHHKIDRIKAEFYVIEKRGKKRKRKRQKRRLVNWSPYGCNHIFMIEMHVKLNDSLTTKKERKINSGSMMLMMMMTTRLYSNVCSCACGEKCQLAALVHSKKWNEIK